MVTRWKSSLGLPVTRGAGPHVQLCYARNDDRGFEPNGAARARRIAEISGLLGQVGASPHQGDAPACLGYLACAASLRGGRYCRAGI